MRIGIDFDNTIISYDDIFRQSAAQRGIDISQIKPNKTALRDHIRTLPDGEITWQKMQAEVYGKKIVDAHLFDGFKEFIQHCRANNIETFIVSHKTEFAAQDPTTNLRKHARKWMQDHGFFDDLAFLPHQIYFESTRTKKIKRIIDLRCTHIIDDLIEVLTDAQLPKNIQKLWFSQNPKTTSTATITQCQTWSQIIQNLWV